MQGPFCFRALKKTALVLKSLQPETPVIDRSSFLAGKLSQRRVTKASSHTATRHVKLISTQTSEPTCNVTGGKAGFKGFGGTESERKLNRTRTESRTEFEPNQNRTGTEFEPKWGRFSLHGSRGVPLGFLGTDLEPNSNRIRTDFGTEFEPNPNRLQTDIEPIWNRIRPPPPILHGKHGVWH